VAWNTLKPWIAGAIAGAVALLWLATAHFNIIDALQFIGGAPMRPVSSGHELVQTIEVPGDQISRVDLYFWKPDKKLDGRLLIQIIEVNHIEGGAGLDAGVPLREMSFETESLDRTAIKRFEFEPLKVKPGTTYGIRLTSDDPEDNAAIVGAAPGNMYNRGRLFIDGEPTEADLYFAFFHAGGSSDLLEKNESWRFFPLNNKWVYITIFLFSAAIFGRLLWGVASGSGSDGNGKLG